MLFVTNSYSSLLLNCLFYPVNPFFLSFPEKMLILLIILPDDLLIKYKEM